MIIVGSVTYERKHSTLALANFTVDDDALLGLEALREYRVLYNEAKIEVTVLKSLTLVRDRK